jgi:RNA polymerase sigma factor (sigma-70 family)
MDEKTPDSGMKRPGGKPSAGEPPSGKLSGAAPSGGELSGGKPPGGAPPPPSPSLREEQASLLQQFVREYRRQLLTMATRMVGRTYAEDVAQEAFVRLAERIERRPLPEVMALLRSPTDLRKLMCRITACRAFEHLSRRERLTSASNDDRAEIEVVDVSMTQRLHTTLDVERVKRAYASLSPMQRIAHVLHYYYGFTDTDFQLTLGISKTNSRTLVSRANRALRRALEKKS